LIRHDSDQSLRLKYFPSIQGNSLANAVVAYCANCDQLETLGPTVAKISSRHVSLEVTPEQYNVVGEVLLLSLEELLGKEVFNEEVKGAVAEGYFFLADIFKENEAKMIADRKAAEVYNLKSSIKVTFN